MAETDVLNCKRGFDPELGDNINPNYGWNNQRASSLAVAKAPGGAPYTRETGNNGQTYQLTWTRRNLRVKERLLQFHERFEQDFFTLRDWDSNRCFSGRFSGRPEVKLEASQRFTVTATFEEVPTAPMLEYPSNWDCWAVLLNPFDGWGNLRCAVTGNWVRPAAIAQDDGTMLTPNALQNTAPGIGDSVTFEYRGYGVRIWANQGTSYGSAQLTIDGVNCGPLSLAASTEIGSQVVYTNAEWPLDIHRAVITMAQGHGIVLQGFEVMR